MHWRVRAAAMLVACSVVGCAAPRGGAIDRVGVKHRATAALEAAVSFPDNPAVRVGAVEALEDAAGEEALLWIRTALHDAEPAVRFAACVACGRLRDKTVESRLRELTRDADRNVQVAALFALHGLGITDETSRIPGYLLTGDENVAVRRNTAMLLGLMGEDSAVKVLARAMRDDDEGVRQQALEGMARLGNREARQELVFMTNSGVGSEEVVALQALAATRDPVYESTFKRKLATADHPETKLAAACGLGHLGSADGLDVAMHAMRTTPSRHSDPNDPPAAKLLRSRQLAAAALGAIGRVEAVPTLLTFLEESVDPRVRVSAARAILQITKAQRAGGLPF